MGVSVAYITHEAFAESKIKWVKITHSPAALWVKITRFLPK